MRDFAVAFLAVNLAVFTLGASDARANADREAFLLQPVLVEQGYSVIKLGKLSTGHEVAQVSINGIEGRFVLDSGASVTILDSRWLETFAVAPPEESSASSGAGAGGTFSVGSVKVSSFAIAGVTIPTGSIFTADVQSALGALERITGQPVHGIIGQDLLTRHRGIIDVGQQTLFLDLRQTAAPVS